MTKLLPVLATIAVALGARSAAGPDDAHVAVVGNDYAFVSAPTTLAAGPTFFSFENRGKVRHEMSIALLKPGVTLPQLLNRPRASVFNRETVDSTLGLLVARPGERSGGQLWATLISGRTYVIVCTLRDTPDAPPHVDLGMATSFTVK